MDTWHDSHVMYQVTHGTWLNGSFRAMCQMERKKKKGRWEEIFHLDQVGGEGERKENKKKGIKEKRKKREKKEENKRNRAVYEKEWKKERISRSSNG